MSTNIHASDATWDDRDKFVDAVREELGSRGLREISCPADEPWLWRRHDPREQTVLGVMRDRDQRFEAADDPLDDAVLLVGGESRREQLYLFEDAIWCWGETWGMAELVQELDYRAEWADACVDGGNVDMSEPIPFRKMLGVLERSRSDLERRFAPGRIESSLEELSEARKGFLDRLCGPVQDSRFDPQRRDAQSMPPPSPE